MKYSLTPVLNQLNFPCFFLKKMAELGTWFLCCHLLSLARPLFRHWFYVMCLFWLICTPSQGTVVTSNSKKKIF